MSVLQSVAQALGELFAPLSEALTDQASFTVFIQELGWDTALSEANFGVIADLLPLADTLESLLETVSSFNSETPGSVVEQVVTSADDIFQTIRALSALTPQRIASLPPPLNTTAFWADFALDLPEYLTITYLQDAAPFVYALLLLGGVIEVEITDEDPPRTLYHLNWSQLTGLLQDTAAHLASLYGWGTADAFDKATLLERLAALSATVGLDVERVPAQDALVEQFYPDDTQPPFDLRQLNLLFVDRLIGSVYVRAGLLLLPIPRSGESSASSLYLGDLLWGDFSSADLTPIEIDTSLNASGALGLRLEPGKPLKVEGGATDLSFAIKQIGSPAQPYLLIGDADGARLQLSGYEIEVRIEGTISKPEIILRAATTGEGLQAIIAPADGDSFIRDLLGETDLSVGADLALEWSSLTGVTFAGGLSLDLTIPLNLKLFALTILELHLALSVQTSGLIEAQADVDASASLDPFTLVVADIGVKATLAPSDDVTARGSFGGMNIDWAFKPPDGVGAAFDFLGLVYGGGYLEFDAEKDEYSGIVTVQLVALGITATAIITTAPPDDPDGWSLFISINVDLGGIPIGFGFTLEKVGGLIGVNRAFDQAVFLAGVSSGLLDSIMFPDDPIANAPRILSDIDAAFPVAVGSFVVGAMLQIGWGTPTLITASVGFIIQLPDVVIMLLGQAETTLPFDDLPLVEIHFDVIAIIDAAAGTFSLRAGLRDSQIVGFVLTGQMAMEASFMTAPSFLLAMGGFHPAFIPPESFPSLDRLSVSLGVGDWLSIWLDAYLALTSNTVQFGAGLHLKASFVDFTIEGDTEINTLIQFSPFQFRAGISFLISISAGSIELSSVLLTGHISGPNPYFVRGVARFKLLGLEQEVDIEETIGNTTPLDADDDIPVLPDVIAALQDPASWHAVDDGDRLSAVLLAEVEAGVIAVHPGGSVEALQRVAPLDVQLEHYGNDEISGDDLLDISDVIAGSEAITWEFSEDWFAPAQFFDFTQAEKLDAPSFEEMKAGLRIGDDAADGGASADDLYDYEQIVYDPEWSPHRRKLKTTFRPQTTTLTGMQAQIAPRNAVRLLSARSAVQTATLKPARYVIVTRDSLTGAGKKLTYAEANQKASTAQIVVTSGERGTSQ